MRIASFPFPAKSLPAQRRSAFFGSEQVCRIHMLSQRITDLLHNGIVHTAKYLAIVDLLFLTDLSFLAVPSSHSC